MEFEIDLPVAGQAGLDAASATLQDLASRIDAAGAASSRASEALAAGEQAYGRAEAAADRAAKAVERIGLAAETQRGKIAAALEAGDMSAADRASAKLATLMARQGEAATKSAAAAAALNAEAMALDKLKSAATSAADAEAKLAQEHKAATEGAAALAKKQKDAADAQTKSVGAAGMLEGAFAKLGGPVGAVGQKLAGLHGAALKLGKTLGDAGPYAVIAAGMAILIASAFVAAAAIGVATLKVLAWAVGLADAARTQGLLAAGIETTVEGGTLLDAKLGDLAAKVPSTREELTAMAAELAKTGLRGKELGAALEAAAVKAAKAKFGPEWQKQMVALDVTGRRVKAGIAGIFGGLKSDATLEGLARLSNMFDKNTETGNAIKVVFESLFQPLLDGLTELVPKAEAAFIQFEMLVLQALIAIKPFGSQILLAAEALGVVALIVGGVLTAVLLVVVGLITFFAVSFGILVIEAVKFGAAVKEHVVAALDTLRTKFDAAVAFVKGITLNDVGQALMRGLADGITAGGAAVVSAMTGQVKGAIDSAKNLLQIKSPSKVFEEIGRFTGEGMAGGIEASAGGVQSSLESMVATPDVSAAPGKGSATGGGVTIGEINFYGVKDGEAAKADVREMFAQFFGELAMQGGVAT